ncbi:MAG: hypothetical protein ACM37W_07305 [Actinomycetota bacterium]
MGTIEKAVERRSELRSLFPGYQFLGNPAYLQTSLGCQLAENKSQALILRNLLPLAN